MKASTKICTHCRSQAGSILPHMKGVVVQDYNIETGDPEIISWTCPMCGYGETETNTYEPSGGTYNSGAAQGPQKAGSVLPPDRPTESLK